MSASLDQALLDAPCNFVAPRPAHQAPGKNRFIVAHTAGLGLAGCRRFPPAHVKKPRLGTAGHCLAGFRGGRRRRACRNAGRGPDYRRLSESSEPDGHPRLVPRDRSRRCARRRGPPRAPRPLCRRLRKEHPEQLRLVVDFADRRGGGARPGDDGPETALAGFRQRACQPCSRAAGLMIATPGFRSAGSPAPAPGAAGGRPEGGSFGPYLRSMGAFLGRVMPWRSTMGRALAGAGGGSEWYSVPERIRLLPCPVASD